MVPTLDLSPVVARLSRLYSAEAALSHPFQLILWENIGYLIDDEKRAGLFEEFGERVGFDATGIAQAPQSVLMDIAQRGGMRAETRVQRWREIARITLMYADGDLDRTLRSLPLPKARALLKKYPAIGDPGADKILLLAGIAAVPSLESNGLRALVRLGYSPEENSYASTYKAACRVLEKESGGDPKWLVAAYVGLREHGRALCKRTDPQCLACQLDKICAHTVLTHM
jgi:endonuclease III